MASKGNLLGMGNHPLLNFSVVDDDEFFHQYNFNLINNAILEEEEYLSMHDQLAAKRNLEYIAGGTTQNTIKAAQWMFQTPGSISIMGYGGNDKFGKEKKKNVKVAAVNAHYYEDETIPIGTGAASVVGGESSLITDLPATNSHKSGPSKRPKRPKNWKLALFDTNISSDKNAPRQLSSKIKLPGEDESTKSFLTGSRAFHGSQVVSETVKAAYLNCPLSPHRPLKKPQQSATYSIYHQIFGIGVTGAVLLFPFVMKYSTLFDH